MRTRRRRALRRVWRRVLDVAAAVVVLIGLLTPDLLARTELHDFVRIPVEGLLLAAVLLVLPWRAGRVVAVLAGVGLALVNLMKVLDTGFHFAFVRQFDPTADWTFLGDGMDFVGTSFGRWAENAALAALAVLIPLGFAVCILSVVRLGGLVARNRRVSGVLVVALGLGWMLAAVEDLRIFPDRRMAARTDLGLVRQKWDTSLASLADQRAMSSQARVDPFRNVPANQLLTGLRGKNVILVFVESYGRSALEDPGLAPPIDALLDKGTTQLAAAGFNARSGWLSS